MTSCYMFVYSPRAHEVYYETEIDTCHNNIQAPSLVHLLHVTWLHVDIHVYDGYHDMEVPNAFTITKSINYKSDIYECIVSCFFTRRFLVTGDTI